MSVVPVKDYTLEEIQKIRMELRNELKEFEKIVSSELVPGWRLQTHKTPDGDTKGIYWDGIDDDLREYCELNLITIEVLKKIERRLLENRRMVRRFVAFLENLPDTHIPDVALRAYINT